LKKYKYIILGAGPSGLSAAHRLLQSGLSTSDILVIEKNKEAGGLCKSQIVDGAPLDTGGGHFLDVKYEKVLEFLFHFMPREEWNKFDRISKIRIHGQEIDHPIEANLWQLPKDTQVEYLESIANAGCVSDEPIPESFSDWIVWKLGNKIAAEYMLPYNKKIWSMDLDKLGVYWLHKLPNVSFREVLESCLYGKPQGQLPAHGTFLYPKNHGYGELWRLMGAALGDSLLLSTEVINIDLSTGLVNGQWQAETIINTIPWTHWENYCSLPENVTTAISKLKNISIDVQYNSNTLASDAHWIYEPDKNKSYHRQLLRSNFVTGARGHWTESNSSRTSGSKSETHFHNEYAYPVNTKDKPEAVAVILEWALENRIIGLGRWGKWEHMNSDIAVLEALQLADSLTSSGALI
jgi:protoporphyrinogen oxidase